VWGNEGPTRDASPVFIVGFPRSGTTLLEQVLDAHPLLRSMDEQPFLLRAVTRVIDRGADYPNGLGGLAPNHLDEIRARYWDDVQSRVSVGPGIRLVDKNPMNLVLLPLIKRLFPNAPIVLAVRHPCDTVLSCFFQHFRSDLALVNYDLSVLARSYARAFGFWHSQSAVLRPTVHELKYERLATDLATEVARLCTFLGLTRHEAMLAPAEHARGKGFISTPSYAQVLEPVTSRSIGRWKNYRRHFNGEVLAPLIPWIRRWGYSLGSNRRGECR
jgi:hypothetical protein